MTLSLLIIIFYMNSVNANCLGFGAGERLENFCLLNAINGKTLDHDSAKIIDVRLRRVGRSTGLGIYIPQTKNMGNSFFSSSLKPLIRYEDNINGGNPAKPLIIGNLSFQGDEKLHKTSGFVGGLSANLNGRTIYAQRRYLDYNLSTSYALSPASSDRIAITNLRACSINHIKKLWFLDACFSQSQTNKQISNNISRGLELTTSHIFTATGQKYNHIKFGINRLFTEDYEQNQLTLSINSLYQNNIFTGLEMALGEAVPNELSTKASLSGIVNLYLAGKPLSLSGSLRNETGGLVYGLDHDAQTVSINVSYPIRNNITVNFGYSKTNSDIDYFDRATPFFGLQFSAVQF